MYSCFFKSIYGYSSLVRTDRIYQFSTRSYVQYILTVNRDLIDYSLWLRLFIHKVKQYLKIVAIAKKITLQDIRSVEIGVSHWTTILTLHKKPILH